MLFLRSLIFNSWLVIWTAGWGIILSPMILMPMRIALWGPRFWAYSVHIMARLVLGIKVEVRGREHIPTEGALIASKHQSAWETIVPYIYLSAPCYILKRELTRIPIYGWWILALRLIAIDRGKGAGAIRDMVRQAQHRIAHGHQVIIFPEGTRTVPGETKRYQPGIAALYKTVNVPVTPVALNSGVCWGRNSFVKKPGKIIIEFLPLIPPGMSKDAFMEELQKRIETTSQKLLQEGAPS